MRLSLLFLSILIIILGNVCFANDTQLHLLAGTTIGATTYAISRERGLSQVESLNTALWVSVAIGVAKEAYDASRSQGKAELKDVTATALGGLVAPLFISSF